MFPKLPTSSPSKQIVDNSIFSSMYQMLDILIYYYTLFPGRIWLLHSKYLSRRVLGGCGECKMHFGWFATTLFCRARYFNTIRLPLSILNNSRRSVNVCRCCREQYMYSIDILCCLWLLNKWVYRVIIIAVNTQILEMDQRFQIFFVYNLKTIKQIFSYYF